MIFRYSSFIASNVEAIRTLQFKRLPVNKGIAGRIVRVSGSDAVFVLTEKGKLYTNSESLLRGQLRSNHTLRNVGEFLKALQVLGVISEEDVKAHLEAVEQHKQTLEVENDQEAMDRITSKYKLPRVPLQGRRR